MTDKDLAQIELAVYGQASIAWDYFYDGTVVFGIKVVEGVGVVACRGSVTFKDWIRDVMAFTPPIVSSKLGPLHPGFLMGCETAWSKIQAFLNGRPWLGIGHSLGAAEISDITAMAVLDGLAPKVRVVWGEPKSGFKTQTDILDRVPSRSYCNWASSGYRYDPVTKVPFSFPPEEYVRSGSLIKVVRDPDPGHSSLLGVFDLHHMPYYAEVTPETPVLL